MSITAEEKAKVIKEYGTKDGDTGSPEVQVAILSSRIATLTEHFKTHKKDNHSLHDIGMRLLAVQYAPNRAEGLILENRRILTDQMEFLRSRVGSGSRLRVP